MALPINIKDLIHARKVENERIEYKKGYNPLEVMQTICAFANDVNNWGGGYIILGIDAKDKGIPIFPIVGIEKVLQDGIYNKIIETCNLIQPQYIPIIDTQDVDGKDIIVIWVTGGDLRPYKCPNDYAKKSDKSYYVRSGSSTRKATSVDERKLFELANKIPFDDRPNQNADIETDLSLQLIKRT
jgi:ATP-dependent DNA helicase RecG